MSGSASTADPTQIIEHVVLFKVKPDVDPSESAAMVESLRSLGSLDSALHVGAGPVHRCRPSSHGFTHILHSRFASKSDLDAYSVDPAHLAVIKKILPLLEDNLAVDWWFSSPSPVAVPQGSAVRATLLKLKEDLGEEEKKEILAAVGGIQDQFPAIQQLSFGENVSTRAKGYSFGYLKVFKSEPELEEFEAANGDKDFVSRDKLVDAVVLDLVLP